MTMNADQIKGRINEAEGTVKEVAGNLVGNKSLEIKGNIQKTLGELQADVGDLKKKRDDEAKK